jgi:transposase-like protein
LPVEQIVAAFTQAELAGDGSIHKEQTLYRWRKQYAGMQSDQGLKRRRVLAQREGLEPRVPRKRRRGRWLTLHPSHR